MDYHDRIVRDPAICGGQPVIRAFNHTGHLAPLLDEAAVEAQEARSRSGAL